MAPGARSKFIAPIFEPEVFRKQMYCIEKSTCDIFGTFRSPPVILAHRSDSAPGELSPPCTPRYARVICCQRKASVPLACISLSYSDKEAANTIKKIIYCIALCNISTPTHKTLDFKHASQ